MLTINCNAVSTISKTDPWTKEQEQQYNEQFKRLLANPYNLVAIDHDQWYKPSIGDRVEIVSWDTQSNVQECVRVCKLPYLTVKEVHPMLVGVDEMYGYWSYTIEVEETDLKFLQWHYKLINQ